MARTRRRGASADRKHGARPRRAWVSAALGASLLVSAACSGVERRGGGEDERALDRDPYALHRGLGMTLLRTGQPAQALPHFRQLERMRPDSPEPHYCMAQVYMSLRLDELAEASLEQALAADPEYAAAHALLGILLDASGRHERAGEAHERAIALSPGHAPYLNNLGFNLFVRDRHMQAVDAYQRALAYAPSSRRIHNNLGFVYGALGELDMAWEHFQRGGPPAVAKNNLGMAHERRGELEAAHALYRAALEDDPALGEARGNLARVSEALGHSAQSLPDQGATE
jgi:protein O-GlcNAc transferase